MFVRGCKMEKECVLCEYKLWKVFGPVPPLFTTIRGYSLSILSYLTKEQKLQKGVLVWGQEYWY